MNEADREFTQAEYDAYQKAGQYIYEEYPEIMNVKHGQELAAKGWDFHKEVTVRIIKEARPDVVAYLNSERGREDRDALLNVKGSARKSLAEYQRIKDVVRRNGLFQRPVFVRTGNTDTDDYLIQRRRDIMHGLRRR